MSVLEADALAAFVGLEAEPPRIARYAVSAAMIRNWAEALEDRNPAYLDDESAKRAGRNAMIAPPAMISTWIMAGYRRWREVHSLRAAGIVEPTAFSRLLAELDRAGYTSVVATDLEQEYLHEVGVGTRITARYTIEAITGPKTTTLGEGWFITLGKSYDDQTGRTVVIERFRMLRYRPKGLS